MLSEVAELALYSAKRYSYFYCTVGYGFYQMGGDDSHRYSMAAPSGSGIFAEVDITRPLQAISFDKHAASRPPEIPVT